MKSKFIKVFIVVFMFSIGSSCSTTFSSTKKSTSVKNLPPGQAKKITGDQSAKKHAPGQKKKKR
jgi:hypothetical protein